MAGTIVNVLRQMESPTAIVFCHTREAVRQLQGILTQRGFSSVAISGDLGQNERSRAIESLRHGQARVCVATDVAARGIDIPDLGLVIHASLPSNPATLLHRSGRTGRAGRKGTCVLLVPPSRRRLAERLLEGAKVTAEWGGAPTPDDIAKADAERLLSAPELSIAVPEAGGMHELITKLTAAHSADQLAAALIAMWRANLPEPTSVRVISPGSVKKAPRERTRRMMKKVTPVARVNRAHGSASPLAARTAQTRNGLCRCSAVWAVSASRILARSASSRTTHW